MNEIILELSALFVGVFCLVDCLKKRKQLYIPAPVGVSKKIRDQHFVYLVLLIVLMVSSFSSVTEVLLEDFLSINSAFILDIFNEIYFLFHNTLSFLFWSKHMT